MEATADDAGDPGRDDVYGYGIVNPVEALTADVPPLSSSATPTASDDGSGDLLGVARPVLVVGGLVIIVLLAAAGVGLALSLRRR